MDLALAVIGGTGVYRLAALGDGGARHHDTPHGAPSGPLPVGRLRGGGGGRPPPRWGRSP